MIKSSLNFILPGFQTLLTIYKYSQIMKQTASEAQLSIFWISIFNIIFICLGINSFAQTYDPLSLHFKKDYQVRNFYSSSVLLSELVFSQDALNESKYPIIHLTSPGCQLKQNGKGSAVFQYLGDRSRNLYQSG